MKKSLSVFKKALMPFLFVASASAALPAFGATEGLNIGALIGADFLSGGSAASSSSLGYGARLGYHVDPNWEFGLSFTTTSNTTSVGNLNTSSSLGLLMAELNYHLPGALNPLYFGARIGTGISSGSTNDPSVTAPNTTSNLAYGVAGGYDFLVSRNFSIGPRFTYTQVTRNAGPNQGDFQAHAAFKYYFY